MLEEDGGCFGLLKPGDLLAPAYRQDRETLDAFWGQIKMDHNLVLLFLAIISFKRDYLKFPLL